MKQGIQRVLMMHAACMSMEGFVMLSSGDEIGQVNDYNYKKNPDTAADSRYLHRSPFQWENAEKRKKPGTVQYAIWNGLKQMEEFRRKEIALERLPVSLHGIQEILQSSQSEGQQEEKN